jgi:integrative and conjugative element protein (TIGR02256 family)
VLLEHPFHEVGANILIETRVIDQLQGWRQIVSSSAEAGGILLGFRRAHHLHVIEATSPASADKRSRFSFWRRDAEHQTRATRGWIRTSGTLDYLGEWHTHPEDIPRPSSIDRQQWQIICNSTTEAMAFVIVGRADWWVGVGLGPDLREASLLSPHCQGEE